MKQEGKIRAIEHPTLNDSREFLNYSIKNDWVVSIFGNCKICNFRNNSNSADFSERLVILKPKGEIIVHNQKGVNPVQKKSGYKHTVEIVENSLILKTIGNVSNETLRLNFDELYHLSSSSLDDQENIEKFQSHKNLKNRIIDNPEIIEPGFKPLATELKTSVGSIDIYGKDNKGNEIAIEVKSKRVGPKAIDQLERYVNSLSNKLHSETTVRGILVGPSITEDARNILNKKNIQFVSLYPNL